LIDFDLLTPPAIFEKQLPVYHGVKSNAKFMLRSFISWRTSFHALYWTRTSAQHFQNPHFLYKTVPVNGQQLSTQCL